MFYTYRQNNSGGSFDTDENVSIYVVIEASSCEDADARAENIGIYFNGCEDGRDCECCGDRWSTAYGKGDEVPSAYGKPLDSADSYRIHYLDGTVKRNK